MASIYSLEIDGWGEVGPAIAITDAEGFANGTFTLTTAGTPPPATEYGAMIWVQDVSAVVADGYYTLTDVDGFDFTMQALPAEVTVTTAAGLSGLARIEDHFKISDSIPSWVTGANAIARWYRDLISVPESAGQRVSALGGISSVDGFDIGIARRDGLAAIAADTYLLSANGPVVLANALSATATEVVTESAAPYAGESASSPTGAAQPAWVGTEAIDVRGTVSTSTTAGVTTYTATHDGSAAFVTRGVLRTFADSHAQGVAVFGAMPTPIGQIGRVFVYPDGHASHADRTSAGLGAVEGVNPSLAAGTAEVFSLASVLLSAQTKTDAVVAESRVHSDASWLTGTQPYRIHSAAGSKWSYILVDGHAAVLTARTGSAPISTDINGIEEWDYLTVTLVDEAKDFPIVRKPDREIWDRLTYARRADVDFGGGGIAISVSTLVWTTGGDVVVSAAESGLPMCHVFSPVTWARTDNSNTWAGDGPRYVQINPVDAILSLITSTGFGHNGSHDLAPREFGMGLDVDNLDLSTFTAVGNRLDEEGITAGTIALLTTEDASIRERLNDLCRSYGLSIVTTTSGAVRLVDMVTIDYDTATTLDEGDLVAPAAFSIGVGDAVTAVTLTYDRPWEDPETATSEIIQTIQATTGGVLEALHRVKGKALSLKPWFAASIDDDTRDALAIRWGRMIEQTNGVVGRITAQVDPGYTGQIGDTVSVTLPAFPNAQDSGGMSGALCRIIDRKHVSRPVGDNPNDEITLLAYGVTSADKPRQWAPSGVVNSVTSKLIFDLESDTYHGPDFTSDATSFTDGSKVDIYSENWSLRSTVSPGTISSTAGDTMTLSVAAAGGSGDVTPNVGDKVTLAAESSQSVSEAAKWGWLTTSTPGYLWR
tara:strand:- start:382 stop:3027 length:2646 start_codon:yes stop_codon:yes gene_type:complete